MSGEQPPPESSSSSSQGADRAAARIQAGFRGYRVRKRLQEERRRDEPTTDAAAGTPTLPDDRTDDPADGSDLSDEEHPHPDMEKHRQGKKTTLEDKSATKIQAGVRGFLVRKRQQAEQAAATRIQAGFRGFRTRKLLKQTGQ